MSGKLIKDQIAQVAEFMTAMGQEVNTNFTYQSTKVANFRINLIDEEINGKNELLDSIDNDNLEKIVDGICDVLVVTYGAALTYGVDLQSMSIKSRSGVSRLAYVHEVEPLRNELAYGLHDFITGIQSGYNIADGLTTIVSSVLKIAELFNVDIIGAFDEVHASNMSKSCKTYEEAEQSIKEKYSAEDSPETYIFKVSDTCYVIRRKSDDKVLKGINFFEPDLTKFA